MEASTRSGRIYRVQNKTQNKTQNKNRTLKRKRNNTNMNIYKPRVILNPRTNPPTPFHKWRQFATEVMYTPIYLISCHSAVCISYERCKTPMRKEPGIPKFRIPANTYILNFSAGGDFCLVNMPRTKRIARLKDEFKKVLLLDSREDVNRGPEPKEHDFVGSALRATQSDYPNISCTFKETGPNILGVFNLDVPVPEFTNEYSMIKDTQLGPYGDDTWYLDDIIQYVYTQTGTNRGIFVFAGCTSGYIQAKTKKNLNGPVAQAILEAHEMIRIADLEYGAKVDTIDRGTIKREYPYLLAQNYGAPFRMTQADPTMMALTTVGVDENADWLKQMYNYESEKNLETAMKLVREPETSVLK